MSSNAANIGVMVVDDHDLVRYGFVSLLSAQEGIEVVAEANTGEKAIERCRQDHEHIDVILMDVNMPGIGGLEATRRISTQWPDIGIIILTVLADGPLPKRLLQGGAKGYLTKGNDVTEMVEAIRDVYSGGRYIAKDIAQQLTLSMLPGQDNIIDTLSKRELQILMMIVQAHKNNDIAQSLNISPKTVSTYRARLHEKLGVNTDIEMLHLAMKHGITG
ncbi:MAG: response regulator [Gammaproteobacteria bacterium]|nr:response regulator [Gammaproteobacteria bacterium]